MVELTKDKKSPTWIITKTDNEGFHRQMNVTKAEMRELATLLAEQLAISDEGGGNPPSGELEG